MTAQQFGPYRLQEKIGGGGGGTVYRAYDTVHDRDVALKLLSPTPGDRNFAARFRREALLASKLRDPHIVPVHTFGEIDGQHFLDMRLVDGVELRTITRMGPMTPRHAVDVLTQIAHALDAAHADGLLHRDVKPGNILVTADEFTYLIDFGIAVPTVRDSATITQTGQVIGTLDYLAPERIRGLPVDGRADVYSLACVLFECITGQRPFPGTEPRKQAQAHLNEPVPSAAHIQPHVSAELDAVITKGMAKDAGERYPTAVEMMRAAASAVGEAAGDATAANPARVSAAGIDGARRGKRRPTKLFPMLPAAVPAGPPPVLSARSRPDNTAGYVAAVVTVIALACLVLLAAAADAAMVRGNAVPADPQPETTSHTPPTTEQPAPPTTDPPGPTTGQPTTERPAPGPTSVPTTPDPAPSPLPRPTIVPPTGMNT